MADSGEIGRNEAVEGAVCPPARITGDGGKDENGEEEVAEDSRKRHARHTEGGDGACAVEQHIVAEDIGRNQERLHDDGGARIGHAFEEAASGEADDAHASPRREGEQVALRFAGDVWCAAEQGRDVGTEQG